MDASLELAQATALGVVIEHPDKAGDVFAAVRVEDFDQQYRAVAEAIHGLRLRRGEISAVSVIDEMTRRGTLTRFGGPAEVLRIAGFGFGSAEYSVAIIARVARLRRLDVAALRLHQHVAEDPDADPHALAAVTATEMQAVMDGVEADGDVSTPTLREFLTSEDPPFSWVVPQLLERGDRLVLTGSEGLGKSVLNRQLAVCTAAGVHPFTHRPTPPMRVVYVDCENGPVKLRRALRPLVTQAKRFGTDPADRLFLEAVPEGVDLTRPEDEAWLVRIVTSLQPDLLLIGPLYRLHAKNPNDEEPARKVARVLDRCRAATDCAMVVEAHAGHGQGQSSDRPIRPTGSSLWLRWPEFGYGMRAAPGYETDKRIVDLVPWRGDREERNWPRQLRSGGDFPWGAVVPGDAWSTPSMDGRGWSA